MMNSNASELVKRIELRLQKKKKLHKSTNARCWSSVSIVLHLNVEGLSANKICVVSQLATKHKALVILLQETHWTNIVQLVIPNFMLDGWVSGRKHGLVYKKISWTLADQSSERSAIEWLYVGIDICKIVNIYTPPTSKFTLTVFLPLFHKKNKFFRALLTFSLLIVDGVICLCVFKELFCHIDRFTEKYFAHMNICMIAIFMKIAFSA